jgi:phytoene dehydrogenase-like protein
MNGKWEAVVIGAGIGGLTCGAFLSKAGMRVKVIEQHSKIGGYAHSFSRGPYRFESGIHSAPIGKNGFIRFLLKNLDIDDRIETISHGEMYSGKINDFSFTMPEELDEIIETLISMFSHEKENIRALFSDMNSLYDKVIGPLFQYQEKGSDKNRSFLEKYQKMSYGSYISSYIKDEKLRQVFYSQWPFCGISPHYASTAFFTLMFYVHAREGSHYLKGGFETLADSLASVIKNNGGEITTGSRVTKVRVENGLAKAIVLDSGEEVESDLVVSNVSPYILQTQLLDQGNRNRLWVRRLSRLKPSVSAVSVYLGLDGDISQLIPHNIMMWHRNSDFDSIFRKISEGGDASSDHMLILKTPLASNEQTLFLMTYFNRSHTDDWHDKKEKVSAQMLDNVEKIYPGVKSHVKCIETASPSTLERYTGNTDGALYGFENTGGLYSEARMPLATHIPNIFQAGHWNRGGGIWNVMECGYSVSRMILQKQRAGWGRTLYFPSQVSLSACGPDKYRDAAATCMNIMNSCP